MNVNTKNTKNQAQEKNSEKLTRAELRRRQKAEAKMEKSKEKKKITVKSPKTQEQEILLQDAEAIFKNLKSYTWRDLETNGKFSKNDKLSFIASYDQHVITDE